MDLQQQEYGPPCGHFYELTNEEEHRFSRNSNSLNDMTWGPSIPSVAQIGQEKHTVQ